MFRFFLVLRIFTHSWPIFFASYTSSMSDRLLCKRNILIRKPISNANISSVFAKLIALDSKIHSQHRRISCILYSMAEIVYSDRRMDDTFKKGILRNESENERDETNGLIFFFIAFVPIDAHSYDFELKYHSCSQIENSTCESFNSDSFVEKSNSCIITDTFTMYLSFASKLELLDLGGFSMGILVCHRSEAASNETKNRFFQSLSSAIMPSSKIAGCSHFSICHYLLPRADNLPSIKLKYHQLTFGLFQIKFNMLGISFSILCPKYISLKSYAAVIK